MAASRRAMLDKAQRDSRRQEALRNTFQKSLKEDIALLTSVQSEKRVGSLRHAREVKAQQQEEELRARTQQRQKMMQQEMLKHEAEIIEMDRQQKLLREHESKERMRQSIRENSWELRELESKLKNAYAVKECLSQIKENEARKQQERLEELQVAEELEQKLAIAKEQEEAMEELKHHKRYQYRDDLHAQLEETQKRKQDEMQRFLEEKRMVDEVVAKILEDDAREARQRLEEQNATKQFIQNFIVERAQWQAEEKARQDAENAAIEAYAAEQRHREESRQEAKREEAAAKSAVYEKLAKSMADKEKGKLEFENLRIELYEQEADERLKAREQRNMEKQIRQRLELIEAYRQQSEDKRHRIEKEVEEEEKYRAMLMQKYAEESRLEQLNDQKRRMKKQEHRHAAEKLIQERRRRIEAERVASLEIYKEQDALSKFRREIIEQERQKLLREHASKLLGVLPRGLLRDQKDLDLFDEEFRQRFKKAASENEEAHA